MSAGSRVEVVSDVPDDATLLATIAAGGEGTRDAFRELYDRHASWLVIRLGRRCSDPGLVDKAVQDTFVAIWRKPQSYRGNGEVELSTHQIDEAAVLADTTVVLDRGRVRFAGPTTGLTALAEGRVWVTDAPQPTATRSWPTEDGRCRNIGRPPAGSELVPARLYDAYFLLLGDATSSPPAA